MMERQMSTLIYWKHLKFQNWELYIAATKKGLCFVGSQKADLGELKEWLMKRIPSYKLEENNPILKEYENELMSYLKGGQKEFMFPMDLYGSDFQKLVWQALTTITYGQTVSYTEIAKRIGKPEAVRAVATAIAGNPILIPVPCHRVIAKNGHLGGYRGSIEMKKDLLALEKASL